MSQLNARDMSGFVWPTCASDPVQISASDSMARKTTALSLKAHDQLSGSEFHSMSNISPQMSGAKPTHTTPMDSEVAPEIVTHTSVVTIFVTVEPFISQSDGPTSKVASALPTILPPLTNSFESAPAPSTFLPQPSMVSVQSSLDSQGLLSFNFPTPTFFEPSSQLFGISTPTFLSFMGASTSALGSQSSAFPNALKPSEKRSNAAEIAIPTVLGIILVGCLLGYAYAHYRKRGPDKPKDIEMTPTPRSSPDGPNDSPTREAVGAANAMNWYPSPGNQNRASMGKAVGTATAMNWAPTSEDTKDTTATEVVGTAHAMNWVPEHDRNSASTQPRGVIEPQVSGFLAPPAPPLPVVRKPLPPRITRKPIPPTSTNSSNGVGLAIGTPTRRPVLFGETDYDYAVHPPHSPKAHQGQVARGEYKITSKSLKSTTLLPKWHPPSRSVSPLSTFNREGPFSSHEALAQVSPPNSPRNSQAMR
jgi:hypothetical protein